MVHSIADSGDNQGVRTNQLETVYLDAYMALPVVSFDDGAADEPLDPSEWGGESRVTGTGPTAVLALAVSL